MKLQQFNAEMLAGDHHSSSARGYSSNHDLQSSHGFLRHSNIKSPGFCPGTSHLLMNIPNRPLAPDHFKNFPNRPPVPNLMNIPILPPVPNHPMNIPNRPAASNLLMNFPNLPSNQNLFHVDRSLPSFDLKQPPAVIKQSGENLQVNLDNTSNSGDHLMEETGDQPVKQTMKVHTKGGDLVLTSDNTDLLHTVKQILQEELPDEIFPKSGSSSTSSLGSSKPELVYQKPELLELASSPVCRIPPKDWGNILIEIPDIVKSNNRVHKEVQRVIKNNPIK